MALTHYFLFSLFGFLLGSTLAGFGMYYYVVDEYKVSNELLTEDIYVSPPIEYRTFISPPLDLLLFGNLYKDTDEP